MNHKIIVVAGEYAEEFSNQLVSEFSLSAPYVSYMRSRHNTQAAESLSVWRRDRDFSLIMTGAYLADREWVTSRLGDIPYRDLVWVDIDERLLRPHWNTALHLLLDTEGVGLDDEPEEEEEPEEESYITDEDPEEEEE